MKRAPWILVAMAAALLPVGCGLLGGRTTFTVTFDEAQGLAVGNRVVVSGVDVGKVSAIELTGDDVRVTLDVDPREAHRINADAAAMVVRESPLDLRGSQRVEIYNGGEDAERARPGQSLHALDTNWEYLAWRTEKFGVGAEGTYEEWAKSMQETLEATQRRVEEYLDSEEARALRQDVEQLLASLAERSRAALAEASAEFSRMQEDLRPKIAELQREGKQAAAKAMQEMLEQARKALEEFQAREEASP